jgi:Fe-S oxidoreductase/nitrate reductase gamma subunit
MEVLAEDVTRQTFQGFSTWQVTLFYVMSTISTVVFAWGVVRLFRRFWQGTRRGAEFHLLRLLGVTLTHVWIGRRAGFVGIAHAGVFYGFLVLFAGTTILAIEEYVAEPLGISFWHGAFYKGYSLFLDIFGAAMILGLVFFAFRRMFSLSVRLNYDRVDSKTTSPSRARYRFDDWIFLWALLLVGVTGFFLESLRIALNPLSFEFWSPIGYTVGLQISNLGIPEEFVDRTRIIVWWIHSVAALTFVAAIPYTKAMHMLTGPSSVATRHSDVGRVLPEAPETGYSTLDNFSFTHKLNLDACTKCGKCHEACPARISGMPLSPRDLILDLREAQSSKVSGELVPMVLQEETLWSCMQCNACVEICPVGIEHVPIINLLRRGLIEEGRIDNSLQTVLASIHKNGNSLGESRRKRARWAKTLDFEVKNCREHPVDVLWWVGDYASFDPRNQNNTRALAQLLKMAGIDFGIVYDNEKTAGHDVRRVGEEGLFKSLARMNIQTISECRFNRILTSDPHSFNTLRNEYPKLGAPWLGEQVLHHSMLLLDLLNKGQLRVTNPINVNVTYHDPCALGRYNGIFQEPRTLIEHCGARIVEMPRNKENSFCCGAGGGRIWMSETAQPDSRRPSEQRIDEATALGDIEYFVVACPKDVSMYEDAIKTSGHSTTIQLREISELVLAATLPLNVLDLEKGYSSKQSVPLTNSSKRD